jgi:ribosomal protein S25
LDIREAKIVPDLRLFTALNVSREHGRKRLRELEEQGVVDPLRTPTGRTLLSFEEAERLSAAL